MWEKLENVLGTMVLEFMIRKKCHQKNIYKAGNFIHFEIFNFAMSPSKMSDDPRTCAHVLSEVKAASLWGVMRS